MRIFHTLINPTRINIKEKCQKVYGVVTLSQMMGNLENVGEGGKGMVIEMSPHP